MVFGLCSSPSDPPVSTRHRKRHPPHGRRLPRQTTIEIWGSCGTIRRFAIGPNSRLFPYPCDRQQNSSRDKANTSSPIRAETCAGRFHTGTPHGNLRRRPITVALSFVSWLRED